MALNIKDQVKCEQLQNQIRYNYYPVKLHRNLISSFQVIGNLKVKGHGNHPGGTMTHTPTKLHTISDQ